MTARNRPLFVVALAVAGMLFAGSAVAQSGSAASSKSAAVKAKPAAGKSPSGKSKAHTAAKKKKSTATAALRNPPLPRPRPAARAAGAAPPLRTAAAATANVPLREAALSPPPRAPKIPLAAAPSSATSDSDMAALRRAIDLVRSGSADEARRVAGGLTDAVARKLAEWIVLRSDDNGAPFARYAAFIAASPSWPSLGMFRRRAEAMLWQEGPDSAAARRYFADGKPLTAKGRLALARALLVQGDRAGAAALAREAWREDAMSADLEAQAQSMFGEFLGRSDDKARMERRLYASDGEAAMRMARRLGGADVALAKARIALNNKSSNAGKLLAAVPSEAHRDASYIFARVQLLRREDKIAEAGHLMLTAPRETARIYDPDEWWVERRLLARKLLDIGDPRTAYPVARDAAMPNKENYRVEYLFTAGWIALRFLNDPAGAAAHFARIEQVTNNPISLARAGYWLGRAAEAAHRPQQARAQYENAARWPTAYYGQLARAKLGASEMALEAPPSLRGAAGRLELVRALDILYALGERSLIVPFMADLGDKVDDAVALAALGDLAEQNEDARGMLQLGKAALARGLPFAQYAFPAVGIPKYASIGPAVEPALVYSIVRQESAFNPGDISSANALGLMQVTPEAGRDTCKRFGCTFDRKRLLSDMQYNVTIGAAELGGVLEEYRGSYIMAFAAYNAGRGRVREWVARYGDPRDPRVDPVDWVERIPFSETRNYVQRVMENLQVYRARFGGDSRQTIEADLRRGALSN